MTIVIHAPYIGQFAARLATNKVWIWIEKIVKFVFISNNIVIGNG